MDKIFFWSGVFLIGTGGILFGQHQIGEINTEGIGLILLAWGIVCSLRGLIDR